MPFSIALSGLDAASSDLKVTGNNIANANTTGFKSSRPEFADIFALSAGGDTQRAIGGGVRLAAVSQDFEQGSMEATGNSLDMAINGEGFFLLNNGGNQLVSRAGAFQVNQDGYIENALGHRLQAYPALDTTGSSFNLGSPSDLRLTVGDSAPQATSSLEVSLNLQADAADLGGTASDIDPTDAATYSYSNSMTVYDSLGTKHTSTVYFRKIGLNATSGLNEWAVGHYIDGNLVNPTAGSVVSFNPDGSLNGSGTIDYDPYDAGNGSNPIDITLDLTNATQFGSDFSVSNLSQDGFPTGRLSNIEIDEKGVISARFTNGQFQALGKVAIASFNNSNGLAQSGDNAWAETLSSGPMQLGEAGTGKFGFVQTGSLEASNVDLAQQMVKLITAQRSFQANAQVISTADAIAQTVINLR